MNIPAFHLNGFLKNYKEGARARKLCVGGNPWLDGKYHKHEE